MRAVNDGGTTLANAGTWWTFTTVAAPKPGSFKLTSPSNNATGRATSLTLSWGSSSNATSYEYCLDKVSNGVCDTAWVNVGATRSTTVSGLTTKTTYSWLVRAVNTSGSTLASNGTWWKFTTA